MLKHSAVFDFAERYSFNLSYESQKNAISLDFRHLEYTQAPMNGTESPYIDPFNSWIREKISKFIGELGWDQCLSFALNSPI